MTEGYVRPGYARYMSTKQAAEEARRRDDKELLRHCIQQAEGVNPIVALLWTRWLEQLG